jgi:FRG domain.
LKISTVQEFITTVESICKKWNGFSKTTSHPWFRGQVNSDWGLLPKIYRGSENSKYEREMFRDFKLRASAYIETMPKNDMEWLFIMQHYGMPTRLLDWSESYLIALYFSVISSPDTDGAVWVIEPWSLNKAFSTDMQTLPMSDMPFFNLYTLNLLADQVEEQRKIIAESPIALRPARNSPRIIAQKGTFTIHGNAKVGLEEYAANKTGKTPNIQLEKITIGGDHKQDLLKQLYLAGISYSTVFPEIEGLSSDISYRYSQQYMG